MAKRKAATVIQISPKNDLIERAERLVMMLFQRDREILERKEKLLNRTLDILGKEIQSQGSDQLATLLQSTINQASKSIEQIIDLKKLQAMSPEMKKSAKAATGAKPA